MSEKWIIDASPLIVLCKVNHQWLFSKLAETVVVPNAVVEEIAAGPIDDPARQFLLIERGLTVVETRPPSAELLAWNLGAGETAVISYGLANPGWIAILDDWAARRCAKSFSLPILGTLAIVVKAKEERIISSAASVLRQLKSSGFRIKDELAREILWLRVHEEW